MSTTVDQRVVQMKFDNADFEKNVDQSMTTLEKLNQKIKDTGKSKAFEELNKAGNSIDLSRVESSLKKIAFRTSALYEPVRNVVNNAINGIRNISNKLKSFTTGAIKNGGLSRAMNIEAARFKLEGLGITWDQVEYSIKKGVEDTAYSLDAAASACAQLSASGVKLGDDMTGALRAISGVAAMTGRSYEDISDIFIKAAGKGKLTGEELTRLSERGINAASALAKAFNTTEANVRDMASKGKISFEMFSKAMEDSYADSAFKANETLSGVTSNIKSAFARIGADFYEPIIANGGPLVKFLDKIRVKVNDLKKALSPLASTLGNLAGGFIEKAGNLIDIFDFSKLKSKNERIFFNMQTGYERLTNVLKNAKIEQKDFELMATEVAKVHGIAIDEMIEKEGSFEATLKNGWLTDEIFHDVITNFIEDLGGLGEATDKSSKSLKNYEKVVKDVIKGVYGNGAERQKKLTEAGYDYKTVQDLVNKTLAGQKVEYEKLSDAQLKSLGYTNQQIVYLRELQRQAAEGGQTVSELLEMVSKPTGRELIFEAFGNILDGLKQRIQVIKEAFREIFPSKDSNVYATIEGFHKLSESFKLTEERAENLKKKAKGFFAVLDIGWQIVSALGKGLATIAGALFKVTDAIWTTNGGLSDLLVGFDKFLRENNIIGGAIKSVANVLAVLAGALGTVLSYIGKFFSFVRDLPIVKELGEALRNSLVQGFQLAALGVNKLIDGLKQLGIYIANILHIDLSKGLTGFVDKIKNLHLADVAAPFKTLFSKLKEFGSFVLNSPIFKIGDKLTALKNAFVGGFGAIRDFLNTIDWTKVKGIASIGGALYLFYSGAKAIKSISMLAANLSQGFLILANGIGGFFNAGQQLLMSAKTYLDSFKKIAKLKAYTSIIIAIAGSIAGLCAALALMTLLDQDKLRESAITMAIVAGGLLAIMGVMAVVARSEKLTDGVIKLASSMLIFSISLGAVILCIKAMGDLDASWKTIIQLGVVMAALIGVAKLLGSNSKTIAADEKFITGSAGLLGFVISLRVFVSVLKSFADMDSKAYLKGLLRVQPIIGLLIAISFLCKGIKASAGLGAILFAISLVAFSKVIKYLADKGPTFKDILMSLDSLAIVLGTMAVLAAIARLAGKNAAGAGVCMLLMSAAMAIMIQVVKSISKLSLSEIGSALIGLAGVGAIMAALLFLTKYTEKANPKAIIPMIIGVGLIGVELIVLASVPWNEIIPAAASLSIVLLAIGYMMKNLSGYNGKVKDTILSVLSIVVLLTTVGYTLEVLSKCDWLGMVAAGAAMYLAFTGLAKAISSINDIKVNKNTIKALLAISVPILALGAAMTLMSLTKWPNIIAAGIAMGLALVAFGKAMEKLNDVKVNKSALKALLAISVPILALGAAMTLMALTDWKSILAAGAAMAGALLALAAAFKIMGNIEFDAKIVKALLAASVMIFSLGVSLSMLAHFNWKQVLASATAMGGALFAVAGALRIIARTDGRTFGKNKFKAMITAALSAVALGAAMALVARYNWSSILAAGAAMSLTMYVLAKNLEKLQDIEIDSFEQIFKQFLASLAMLVPVTAALYILAGNDWASMIGAAGAISICLLALSGALAIASKMEVSWDNGAAILLASLSLIAIGYALSMVAGFGWDGLLPALASIGGVLLALAAVTAILSKLGPSVILGAVYLDAIILVVGALVALIGWLDELTNGGLLEVVQRAVPVMEGIGEALGKLIGGLVGGAIATVMDLVGNQLPAFGQSLSDFMTNIQGFLDGCSNIPDGALAGAGQIALIIAALGAAEMVNALTGLITWITGGQSLPEIGQELSDFALSLGPFIDAMKSLGPDAANAGLMMSEMITNLTGASVLDGLTSWFTGGVDFKAFGEGLCDFADGIVAYAAKVGNSGADFTSPGFMNSVMAAKVLAGLEENLPKHGGVLQKFLGDNDLKKFGSGLEEFGEGMVKYAKVTKDTDFSHVEESAAAGHLLAELESSLPAHGGKLQTWFGDNDLKKFGSGLASFGQSMVDYVGITKDTDFSSVEKSAGAGQLLANLESSLPAHDGKLSGFLFGDSANLAEWGDQVVTFGQKIMQYEFVIRDLNIKSVEKSVAAGQLLSGLESGLTDNGGLSGLLFGDNDLGKFGDNLVTLGKGMRDYGDNVKDLNFEAIAKATSELSNLSDTANLLKDDSDDKLEDFGGAIKNFAKSLNDAGEYDVTTFIDAIKNKISTIGNTLNAFFGAIYDSLFEKQKDKLKTIGASFTSLFETSIKNNAKITMPATAQTMIFYLTNELSKGTKKAEELGKNFVQGYVKGLKDPNELKGVKNAAKDMTKMATDEVAETQDSHSPSIVTWLLGKFFGDGYINGIAEKIPAVKNISEIFTKSGINIMEINTEKGIEGILDSLGLGMDGIEEFADVFKGNCEGVADSAEKMEKITSAKYALLADSIFENTNAAAKASEKMIKNNENVAKTFNDYYKGLNDTISGSMDIFKAFDKKTELSGTQLLENMRSQVNGMLDWKNKITELSGKAIDQGILQKLAAMGPEGYEYVNAFTQMTADQLAEAGSLFQQSLTLPDLVTGDVMDALADSGMNVVLGIAKGIKDNGRVVKDGMIDLADGCIVDPFETRMDMHSPSRVMAKEGLHIVEGVGVGIQDNTKIPRQAIDAMALVINNEASTKFASNRYKKYGVYIIEGLKAGLSGAADGLYAKASEIAEKVAGIIEGVFEIESPSHRMARDGMYIDQGLANGIRKYSRVAVVAAEELANDTLDGFNSQTKRLADIINWDMDLNPVITPRLDLTDIKAGTNRINEMMNNSRIGVSGQFQNGEGTTATVGNSISFVQNNYSPEALSRIDIYRDTKNQLSMLKGLVF